MGSSADRISPAHLLILLAVGLAALPLAGLVWSRQARLPGAGALSVLLLALGQILICYAMSFGDLPPEQVVWWIDATYLGWLIAPTALMVFVARLTGRDRWLTRRALLLLAIEPIVMGSVIWSDAGQRWFFAGGRDPVTYDFEASGAAYVVFVVYAQAMLAIATVLVILAARSSRVMTRRQVVLVSTLVLLPWIVSFFSFVNAKILGADPTVVSLIALVAFSYALTQFRILDIRPLMSRAYTDRLGEGVVVLDAQGRIVEINATAARLLGTADGREMGMRIEDAWADAPHVVAALVSMESVEIVTTGRDGSERLLQMDKTALSDREGSHVGTLVVVRGVGDAGVLARSGIGQ